MSFFKPLDLPVKNKSSPKAALRFYRISISLIAGVVALRQSPLPLGADSIKSKRVL